MVSMINRVLSLAASAATTRYPGMRRVMLEVYRGWCHDNVPSLARTEPFYSQEDSSARRTAVPVLGDKLHV